MKTLVIQLDRSEDTGSIRDKVTWGKSSRVLLVWPTNYVVFDRKIDLVAIKRICTSQGSRLGIVSDDPLVCAEAEELQIPVFDSVTRAMRKGWDRRRRRKSISSFESGNARPQRIEDLRINQGIHRKILHHPFILRISTLTVGILSVFALILFILPYAEIHIYPVGQKQEMKVEFQVDSQQNGTSNPGILHGTMVKATVEGEITGPTTGIVPVPDKKSKGNITLTNQTEKEIQISVRTIVINNANPPVRYTILQDVSIPPEESVAGVAIEAIYAGEVGNSGANTINLIDGELGLQVELTNPEPVSGGSSKNIPAPSEDDLQMLRVELQTRLVKAAEKQFSTELKPDEILLPASILIGKVVSEKTTPEIGHAGTSVKLIQKAEYSGLVISQQNLNNQAESIFTANLLQPGWTVSNRDPIGVQILAQEFDRQTNTTKIQTLVKGNLIPIVDTENIRQRITGTSREKAEIVISSQVLSDQPTKIETWPVWLPFLPWIESRIIVTSL